MGKAVCVCNNMEGFGRNASMELDISELGYVVPGEEEKCLHPSLRV